MTCAHRCLLNQLLAILDALPEDDALRIRRTHLPADVLGDVDFDTHEIRIADTATTPEFRATLAHELVHIQRGAYYPSETDDEEALVEATAARLLVPRDHLPAILEAADPHQVADELVVDLHTATLGIALARADEQAVQSEGAA